MRFQPASLCILALALACTPDGSAPGETTAAAQNGLESVTDRASYAIGYNLGRNFREQQVEANLELLQQGLRAGFRGDAAVLTDEEIQTAVSDFQTLIQTQKRERDAANAARNKEAGRAFLAENGRREGVVTTSSGLQYEVIEETDGMKPAKTDTVDVHYRGTLIDGTLFDSSYDRGQPSTFAVNQVIAGWTEGLQLMSAGSRYKFYIPSRLAYGDQGAGQTITAGSTLIFEVELISIVE